MPIEVKSFASQADEAKDMPNECFVIKESYKVALPPTSGFIKQDRWHGS